MKRYSLKIAGYRIRFESTGAGLELSPSERFRSFIYSGPETDVLIRIHPGRYHITNYAEKVFNAPYVEEINGVQIKKSEKFWSIYKKHKDLFIKTSFPLSPAMKNAVVKFSLTSTEWDMWIDSTAGTADPLEYPLDGLILYYLTAIHGDIMIHASGVNNSGKGYLFSGISGKGKTTMASLWDKAGAKVIHDDRLIIRKTKDCYTMYNTPVYKNDTPCEFPLDRIFLIEHGENNKAEPLNGASIVSMVMANCIQHNWSHEIIDRLLGSVSEMCSSLPGAKLHFVPDNSVIDYILKNE